MTGPKTNERPGTRAQVKYVRSSAYKAREVLDEIRGESYGRATEILAFSERGIAREIRKVLDSCAANAEHNDHLDAEELFVSACYADEGPTLKRFRPRARGRASRIRKRTCHITVILTRYDDSTLERLRERAAARGQSGGSAHAADDRRRRVEQSRQRAEAAKAAEAEAEAAEAADDEVSEAPVADADADADVVADTVVADTVATEWDGSVEPPADGSIPEGYAIKGNKDSMKYHQPDGQWYEATVAEVFFNTAAAAEAAGFIEAGTAASSDTEEDE